MRDAWLPVDLTDESGEPKPDAAEPKPNESSRSETEECSHPDPSLDAGQAPASDVSAPAAPSSPKPDAPELNTAGIPLLTRRGHIAGASVPATLAGRAAAYDAQAAPPQKEDQDRLVERLRAEAGEDRVPKNGKKAGKAKAKAKAKAVAKAECKAKAEKAGKGRGRGRGKGKGRGKQGEGSEEAAPKPSKGGRKAKAKASEPGANDEPPQPPQTSGDDRADRPEASEETARVKRRRKNASSEAGQANPPTPAAEATAAPTPSDLDSDRQARKDMRKQHKEQLAGFALPQFKHTCFSIYWKKSTVGLKLRNVEVDAGKQVVHIAAAESVKDNLDCACLCAEIIDSTKGIMTEAAQNQIQVIKNNFKECHARLIMPLLAFAVKFGLASCRDDRGMGAILLDDALQIMHSEAYKVLVQTYTMRFARKVLQLRPALLLEESTNNLEVSVDYDIRTAFENLSYDDVWDDASLARTLLDCVIVNMSGKREDAPFASKVFSSGTLAAGIQTMDFQQIKLEAMEREAKEFRDSVGELEEQLGNSSDVAGVKRLAATPASGNKMGSTPNSAAPPPRKKRPDVGESPFKPVALFHGTSPNLPDLGNDSQLPSGYLDTQIDSDPYQPYPGGIQHVLDTLTLPSNSIVLSKRQEINDDGIGDDELQGVLQKAIASKQEPSSPQAPHPPKQKDAVEQRLDSLYDSCPCPGSTGSTEDESKVGDMAKLVMQLQKQLGEQNALMQQQAAELQALKVQQAAVLEALAREPEIRSEKKKEMVVKREGDFYSEKERVAEIKAYAEQHPQFKRKDTYNQKRELYWYEERISASMTATSSLTTSDTTTVAAEVARDEAGNAVLGRGVGFDMSGLDDMSIDAAAASSSGAGPTNHGQVEAELNLPSLQGGKKGSELVTAYMKGLLGRSTKLSDLLGKLADVLPTSDRVASTVLVDKITACAEDLDQIQDDLQNIFSSGAVEGYTDEQEVQLIQLFKRAKKTGMESITLESRLKAVFPKRGGKANGYGPAARKLVQALANGDPAARIVKLARALEEEMPDASMPWEDVSLSPTWLPSIGAKRPWNEQRPPSTVLIPFCQWAPERLHQSDMMHVVKLGIGRHFCASTLVVLSHWECFPCPNRNIVDRLASGYQDFWAGCKQMRATPHVKSFSREMLHFPNERAFPYGGWKAADTMLICRWIVLLLRDGVAEANGLRTAPVLGSAPLASHQPLL
ncbi:unnamed protein product [Symbiodinium sp. KB8]|nr:unnamed protein product [Symbiodinium sp. KB8]